MADPNDILSIKNFSDQGLDGLMKLNTAIGRENDIATNNAVLQDRVNLTPVDFMLKYGTEVSQMLDVVDVNKATTRAAGIDRNTGLEGAGDVVNSTTQGFVNAAGGLGVFGARAFGPEAASSAADLLAGYNQWAEGNYTPSMQNSNKLDAIRADLDQEDNLNQYKKDVETDGELVASLKMIGRDVIDAGGRMLEDPRQVGSLVAEGTGSLVAGALAGGGLAAIGSKVLGAAVSAETVLPAVIGGMEGGGAFVQANQDVKNMSFDELAENSPDFRNYILEGMTPDQARERLSQEAGDIAMTIQTPVAVATGKLVAGFEAAPFATKGIAQVGKNILTEAIEEGTQSASGQIGSNIAIAETANENQNIAEGVGSNIAQGAVGGSLSAGAVQGPGFAFQAIVNSAKAGARTLDDLLLEREQRIKTANDAASPVSEENLTAAAEALPAKATTVAESTATLVPPDADEASKAEAAAYAERIVQSSTISPENLAAIPEHIRAKLPESNNLFVTLKGLGDIVADEENTKADRVTAVLSILSQMAVNENLLGDLPAFLAKADKTSEQYKQFEDYNLVLNNLRNAPSIQQAMQWAMEGNLQDDVEITPERAATPEGQQDIQNAVNIAENIPSAVNEKVNDTILYMADRGDITLTDIQRNALLSAKAILDAQRAFEKEMGATEGTPYITQAAETVSKQIETEGGARPYQYSLEGHVRRINEAKSNKAALKDRLRDAVLFAMHMRNKASSLAQAIANGDGKKIPYKTLGNKGWLEEKQWNSVYYIPGNENSKKIAQRIHAEASAMALLSNSLKALYPEYNIPEITIPAFNLEGETAPTVVSQESESKPVVSQDNPVDETQTPNSDSQNSVKAILSDAQRKGLEALGYRGAEIDAFTPEEADEAIEAANKLEKLYQKIEDKQNERDRLDSDDEEGFNRLQEEIFALQDEAAAIESGAQTDAIAPEVNSDSQNSSEPELVQSESTEQVTVEPVQEEAAPEPTVEAVEPSKPVDEETPTEPEKPASEAPKAEEAPPKEKLKLNLKKTFADLLGSDNRFRKSFTYPGDATSRLVTSADPIADVQEVLNAGQEAIEGIAGTKVRYTLTSDHVEGFEFFLHRADDMVEIINNNLQTKLDEELNAKTKETLRQKLDSGDESPLYWGTTRPMAIMEKTDGVYAYNQNLLGTAVLAGLDWAINDFMVKGHDNAEDISQATGIPLESITEAFVTQYNLGMSYARAKRDLARKIQTFWGVQVLPDADIAHAQGILEGVAAEVLSSMEEVGLFNADQVKYEYEKESKGSDGKVVITDESYEFNRYRDNERDEDLKAQFRSLNGAKRLIGDLVVVDNLPEFFVDQLPPPAPEFQLRNQFAKNSEKARKALDLQAQTPFYLDSDFADMILDLDRDEVMRFLGGQPGVTEASVNAEHKRSLDGINTTLSTSFENTAAYIAEIRNIAKTKGVDATTVPVYYSANMTSVGRLQFGGLNNVQSDKLARHIISSTKEVIDITKPEGLGRVWMTVGQGLGIKTEYQTRDYVQQESIRLTLLAPDGTKDTGKFYDAVQAIETWYSERNATNAKKITAEINKVTKGDNTVHLLFSLHQAARIKMALDAGKGAEFTSYGYLEADGKTNGLANALAMLTNGEFTGDWLRKVAKAGYFIGSGKKTLADHYQQMIAAKDAALDLYKQVAITHQRIQQEYQESIKENKELSALYNDLMTVFRFLDIGVTFDGENIVIDRKVTKNPLTITVYGSGVKGIAGNLTSELVNMVYAEVSTAMRANAPFSEEFTGAWDRLMTKQITKGNKIFTNTKKRGNREIGRAYKLSANDFNRLRDNIQKMFVSHMVSAIDLEIMDYVKDSTTLIQRVTNAQSIFLNTLFNAEVVKTIAAKKKVGLWKEGDFLSRNEMAEIQKSLQRFAPTLTVGDQNYYLSAGEATDIARNPDGKSIVVDGERVSPPKEFGADLAGKFRSSAYYFGPGILGVGGMPKLNIGNGDGQMIITGIADYGAKGLPVFDGFHMAASRIDRDGEAMNHAVYDTWQNNPMKELAKALRSFLEADPFKEVLDNNLFMEEFITNISRNYNGMGGAILTLSEVRTLLENNLADMERMSDQIEARNLAINMFPVSVDQMASAEAAHFREGMYPSEATSQWSPEDMAFMLNKAYFHFFGLETGAPRTGIPQGQTLDLEAGEYRPKLPEAKQLYYAEDDGVQVISTNDLPVFIDTLQKKVSKQHKEMLTNTLKRLKDSGYKVVFGLPSELRRWENRNFPMNTDGVPYEGKTDVANKIIYISNENVETIVHELIHAATFDKVNAYYKNKGSLSAADISSLDRIEGLMKEWLAAEPEGDVSVEFEQANDKALLTIRDRLAKGQKAAALNEFMAWSLANKEIAEVQKTVKVKSPVLRIVGDALIALWRLIWGNKFAPVPGDTIYSNLRFNTRVLLATPYKGVQVAADLEGISLYQSAAYGNNDRINALTVKLVQKINGFIQSAGNLVDVTLRQKEYQSNLADALDTTQIFMAQGFAMNMQEKFLFQVVQALLATNAKVNTNSLSAIQDIYAHVMENLKVEDFMQDRDANEDADRYQAQRKYDALTGVFGTKVDSNNRSNLMPSFLALAMVDEQFRSIIAGMKKPEKYKSDRESLDGILENLGMAGVDLLGSTMSTAGANLGLLGALDALVNELGAVAADQQSFIEQNINKTGDAFDNYIATWRDKTGKKLLDENKGKTGAKARAARLIGTLFNDEASSKWVDGIISKINKADGLNTVRELVAEIVGPKADNASFYRMINRVRAAIQQTRQQYREHLPEKLAEAFSRKLSADEWSLMFKGFAKTDLSALFDHIGLKKTINMIGDNAARAAMIQKLEADLDLLSPKDAVVQIRKAKDLAEFMVTGKTSTNHLRNAYAVAHMLGEKTSAIPGSKDAAVNTLDQLITLYAVDNLPTNQCNTLSELINNERKGVEKTVSFLIGERRDELTKTDGRAKINGYKGYIPSDNQLGVSMIVADDQEGSRLRSMGYVRLGDYRGSAADTSRISRGYYFSPVSGKATYNQGVLQTVHQTASGVDPHTGYSMDLTAGRITNRDMVKSIARNLTGTPSSAENLQPIFDTNGDVVAYERGIDPEKLTHLNRNTDLSQMMGAWVGRQIEERLAYHFNRQLIDVLKKHYDEGKLKGRGDEYIDLISSKDPIHQDTWALIPNSTRDEIKAVFGDKFMIRKDMLNDAVGYREASIGDLWTGNSRMKPAYAEAIRKRLTGIFGEKAFSYFVNAEKFVQNVVTEAKVLIVVKSVIVPLSNMISNIHQLMLRGVPIRSIIHGLGSKTAELNDFIKRRKRQLELEADLRSAEAVDNSLQMRRIENELRAIKDSYKRMSIYPLIEAGEFSSISDGGITQEDIALSEGRWGQFIEKLADKVPDVLKVPARYALLTRDTALFQGLTRAVQYGDFLGKAILYDDLVGRKKINRDDALTKVSEEFVNYNRLAGRNRNYLESIGLMWFWNFKLRSIRTAVSMIRENPFRAFMYSNFGPDSIPLAGDIGSPIEDNALAIIGQGKAGYSLGPAMGLGSWSLNPLVNILH